MPGRCKLPGIRERYACNVNSHDIRSRFVLSIRTGEHWMPTALGPWRFFGRWIAVAFKNTWARTGKTPASLVYATLGAVAGLYLCSRSSGPTPAFLDQIKTWTLFSVSGGALSWGVAMVVSIITAPFHMYREDYVAFAGVLAARESETNAQLTLLREEVHHVLADLNAARSKRDGSDPIDGEVATLLHPENHATMILGKSVELIVAMAKEGNMEGVTKLAKGDVNAAFPALAESFGKTEKNKYLAVIEEAKAKAGEDWPLLFRIAHQHLSGVVATRTSKKLLAFLAELKASVPAVPDVSG
jgi:hypothetical protein